MSLNSIICLDFETGGLSPSKNPATSVAYQAFELTDYKPILEYSTYIQPYAGLKIEQDALDYSNTTHEQIASGIDTKALCKQMQDDFANANTAKNFRKKPILLGHNVVFDIGFLCFIFKLHKVDIAKFLDCGEDYMGNPIPKHICTMQQAKMKWGHDASMTKYNLSACMQKAGLDLHDAHNAMNDVKATKELFFYLTNSLRSTSGTSAQTEHTRFRNHFNF